MKPAFGQDKGSQLSGYYRQKLDGELLEEFTAAYMLSAKWLTLPLLVIFLLLTIIKKDYYKLWQFCLYCLIVSVCGIPAHGVIAFNKHVGESRPITLSGYIRKTKPGKGGSDQRMRDVVLMTPNGLVRINIVHHLFEKNKDGDHFSIDCRVGSLGLVFL